MNKTILAAATLLSSMAIFASPVSIEEPGPFLNVNDLKNYILENDSNPQFISSKTENQKNGKQISRYSYQSNGFFNLNADYPQSYVVYEITKYKGNQIDLKKIQVLMNCANRSELVLTTSYMSSGKVTDYTTTQGAFDPKHRYERLEACNTIASRPAPRGLEAPVERLYLSDYKKFLDDVSKSNLVYSRKDKSPVLNLDYYIFKDKPQGKLIKDYPDAYRAYTIGYSPTEVKVMIVSNVQYNCTTKKESLRYFREFGTSGYLKMATTSKSPSTTGASNDETLYCENK